jgi:hypothetical protein
MSNAAIRAEGLVRTFDAITAVEGVEPIKKILVFLPPTIRL